MFNDTDFTIPIKEAKMNISNFSFSSLISSNFSILIKYLVEQ